MKQHYIVIILSVLLFLFLLWKEIKRPDRARLALRLIATMIAVVMLALLMIPLTFLKETRPETYPAVLLLTPGAGRTADTSAHYRLITTDQTQASSTVTYIPDLSFFIQQHMQEIPRMHITGKGIDEHEWNMLDQAGIPATYTAPATPEGIVQADWPRVIPSGDKLRIQGTYNNLTGEKIKLLLRGLGTSLDSVIIEKDSSQAFNLGYQPAHTGNTLYELQTIRDGKIISVEKIPVKINLSSKPRILFLASSPGFENKFLGSWLYENNYPAAIRTTISRGKYDQQILNTKVMPLNSISSSLLDNIDLVIADDNALSELSPSAAAGIKMQVQKGMGLIIQSDSSATLSSFSRAFTIRKQGAQKIAARSLIWQGTTSKSSPLAAGQWLSIGHDPFAQAVVTDDQQAIIASCRLYGAGKILLNTATSTYSWALSGNKENYSSFWSSLISKTARTAEQTTTWHYSPAFASVDQPVKLVLGTTSAEPPVIKTASGELYTAQTPYLPDTWTANWWPATSGWQTLSCTDTASIYVFEEKDWSAAKEMAQVNRNIMHAAKQTSTLNKINTPKKENRTVPVWIFYTGFVGACLFLWWEARLR